MWQGKGEFYLECCLRNSQFWFVEINLREELRHSGASRNDDISA